MADHHIELTLPKKVVRLAVQDYCPFVCVGRHSISGAHVEILRELFLHSHFRIEFVEVPFVRALRDTRVGALDGVMAILKNDDRAQHFFYDTPITQTRSCFYTPASSRWHYNSVESLGDVKFGMVRGYIYAGEVGDYFAHPAVKPFIVSGGDAELRQFRLLVGERFDALNENEAVADYVIAKLGFEKKLRKAGCQRHPDDNYLAISRVSLSGPLFRAEFVARIQAPSSQASIAAAMARYGIHPVTVTAQVEDHPGAASAP